MRIVNPRPAVTATRSTSDGRPVTRSARVPWWRARSRWRLCSRCIATSWIVAAAPLRAQAPPQPGSVEPFKVGTFEIDGEARVGIVLRDAWVVDARAANRALEGNPTYPPFPMPADMLGVVERYDYGVKRRLYEIVNHLAAAGALDADERPAYVRAVGEEKKKKILM